MKNYSKPAKPSANAKIEKHMEYAKKLKEYGVAVLISKENKTAKGLIAKGKFVEAENITNKTMRASQLLENGDSDGAKKALEGKSSNAGGKSKSRGISA